MVEAKKQKPPAKAGGKMLINGRGSVGVNKFDVVELVDDIFG